MDLTDEQWAVLEPLLPERPVRADKRGRPLKPNRDVLNGVLWVMRTGAPWKDMPGRYPPYATGHRRFSTWVENGTMRRVVEALARDLRDRGKLDLEEAFVDGSFAPAKKGAAASAKRSAARGQDHGSGRPLWSSSRRRYRNCFPARVEARGTTSSPELPSTR
jgi:transposase